MPNWNVYIGCFTEDLWRHFGKYESDQSVPSTGVARLLLSAESGELQYIDMTPGNVRSPQYLRLHPTRQVLYGAEFARPGGLVAYRISNDGALENQANATSLGSMTVAVAIHPAGLAAYVAHLGDGALTEFKLRSDGEIGPPRTVRPGSEPAGAVAEEAALAYKTGGSKLHQVQVSPDGRWLVTTDVGRDQILVYGLRPDGRVESDTEQRITFPENSAPRHLEFHPGGRTAYVVGEKDSRLYAISTHEFRPMEIVGAYPIEIDRYNGERLPSELQFHPDQRTLFIAVRRAESIVVFDADADGKVEKLYDTPSLGRNPRGIRVDPSGKNLLVAHWQSNSVVTFRIGPERDLQSVGQSVAVPSPSSIVMRRAST